MWIRRNLFHCKLLAVVSGNLVGAAGIEPATLGLEIRCSIRLSYAPSMSSPRSELDQGGSLLGAMRASFSTVILPHGRRSGRAGSADWFCGCDDRSRVTAGRQKGDDRASECRAPPHLAVFEM